MGKFIEPVIKPLGYDWKIGIALITSFAAREVFVSTIATLYSVGGDAEDELTIMWQEIIVFGLFFGIITWWVYKTYFRSKSKTGEDCGCNKCHG